MIIQHYSPGKWSIAPSGKRPHIIALFRDPGIQTGRDIETVLDLIVTEDGFVKNRRHCWTAAFVNCFKSLPLGFTVALENGVRCPCPQKLGIPVYIERLRNCFPLTQALMCKWEENNQTPPIAVCDKDLSIALSKLGILTSVTGDFWEPMERFIESVGSSIQINNHAALILAHPIVVSRKRLEYEPALKSAVQNLVSISNWSTKQSVFKSHERNKSSE